MPRRHSLLHLVLFALLSFTAQTQAQSPGPAKQAPFAIAAEASSKVIDGVLKQLVDKYVFPDIAEKMQAAVRARQENKEYDKIATGQELAKVLTAHLQEVSKDKHIRVVCSTEPLLKRTNSGKPSPREIERFNAFTKMNNAAYQKVERLAGNVGYLELTGFADADQAADRAAAALNFLAGTDALIIDIRRNGGGSPKGVALLCSYLLDETPIHLNSFYLRQGDRTEEFWTLKSVAGKRYLNRDVFVLTSKRTFSAAEEFAYNLKNLKRATIVGETTGGGAHPGGTVRVDDHFKVFVPTGRAINPITKTNWEGTGVVPDIVTSADKALEVAHQKALERLLTAADDETRKMIENDLDRNKVPRPAIGAVKGKAAEVTADQATEHFRNKEWDKCVTAYEPFLKANPKAGGHWFQYGYALHSLKRYADAIKAAEKAVELEFKPAIATYNIACAHALLGNKDKAISFLQKAIEAGFMDEEILQTDTDLDSIRDDPRVKKLLSK